MGRAVPVLVLVIAASPAAFRSNPLRAQAEPAPSASLPAEHDLGVVESRATRDSAPFQSGSLDAVGSSSVIELSRWRTRESSAAELLGRLAGVRLAEFGGLSGFTAMEVRGSGSQQVEVFLDGMPLNPPGGGGFDLSTITLDGLERMELYRGQSALGFGESGMGGALHLFSREFGDTGAARLSAGAGSFGQRRIAGFARVPSDDTVAMAHWEQRSGAGDFPFDDDRATPFNPADDVRARRANNRFRQAAGGVGARYAVSDSWDVSLATHHFQRHQGLPGVGAFPALAASLDEGRDYARHGWRYREEGASRGALDMDAFLQETQSRLRDPHSEIGLSTQRSRELSRRFGASMQARRRFLVDHFAPLDFVEPVARLSLVRETQRQEESLRVPANEGDHERLRWQPGAGLLLSGFEQRVTVVTQAGYDGARERRRNRLGTPGGPGPGVSRHRDRFLSSRLGLSLAPLPDAWSDFGVVTLRANVGRYQRRPSFAELFGDRGAVLGNEDLRPETGRNRDAALAYDLDIEEIDVRMHAEAGVFENQARDLILFVPNSQRVARAENLFEARLRGRELSGALTWGDHLEVFGHSSFLDAVNQTPIKGVRGRRLPLRVKRSWALGVEGGFSPLAGVRLELFADQRFQGENFRDTANFLKVPARRLRNAGVTLSLPDTGLSLAVEVHNLGDEQVADYEGYPLPGRSVSVTMTAEW